MASTQALYDELLNSWRKATLLGSVQGQLGWDEQTYLPAGGAAHRADQMSLLAGMVHQQLTAPRLGDLIAALETGDKPAGSNGVFEANVREARRRYDRLTKLPTRLVEELTRVTSLAQQNWVEARKKSNFAMFQPWLEHVSVPSTRLLRRPLTRSTSSAGEPIASGDARFAGVRARRRR